ncbi:MAG: CRISPR-associated RAMP protein Csx7 [Leptolyngbyaceae cyanobacterium bins.302]|nr:CRISPR-associated RAMP protein Csx7 [Leptolyngbyaceae cyanobacterium bins.302]
MFDTFKNRLELKGVLTTVTALRISQGRSMEPIGSDLPVVKDALGRPLIPGSSFKGALRSRLESFLRGILGSNRELVSNPAIEEEWSITSNELRDLKNQFSNDVALTNTILAKTDLVSQLFGSPWLSSKLQIQDLNVVEDAWFGQYQERDGVAIDRDTETAADGKLYDFQVVPAGTSFHFRAIVENAEEWELGLLMIGLHQFETEQIPLGGGRSRGLGVVRLNVDRAQWFDTENNPERLLGYLQQIVQGDLSTYACSQERLEALKAEWTEALIGKLRTMLQGTQSTASEQTHSAS